MTYILYEDPSFVRFDIEFEYLGYSIQITRVLHNILLDKHSRGFRRICLIFIQNFLRVLQILFTYGTVIYRTHMPSLSYRYMLCY